MKTKIIAINSQFVHLNLAVRSLNASIDHKAEVLEFNINTDITQVYNEILLENADLIMFSTYIWNIDYVLRLTRDLKFANPDLKIALGGPEVSFTPYEIIENNSHIDYILCGECELMLGEFIQTVENNGDLSKIKGVVYGKNLGDSSYNLVDNLDDLAPAKDVYRDTPVDKIYYYETSRGCPFSCSYCLSGSIKDKTRYLSLERVFADLKYFLDKNIQLVKFVDRTFNANKARAKEIIRFLIANEGVTSFHFEVGADILDDEIIDLLNSAPKDKFQLEAGVQSCHKPTLEAVVRTTDFDKLSTNVKKIIDGKNVHLHLDLIAGLPFEDFETFGKSINKLYDLEPHHLQIGFLKLLKGSKLAKDAKKYGIIYRDYAPYEVISTDVLSANEIVRLKHIEEIVERYYNKDVGRQAFDILKTAYNTPFDMLLELSSDFNEKGYLTRPMNVQNRLQVLCEFAKNKLSGETYNEFLYSVLYDICVVKGNLPPSLGEIVLNIDNKPFRNKLFELGKINGDEFKKGKFFITEKEIIMSIDGSYNVYLREEIKC